jgi:hypothetical protein
MNWSDRDKTMLLAMGALALSMVLIAVVYARWLP